MKPKINAVEELFRWIVLPRHVQQRVNANFDRHIQREAAESGNTSFRSVRERHRTTFRRLSDLEYFLSAALFGVSSLVLAVRAMSAIIPLPIISLWFAVAVGWGWLTMSAWSMMCHAAYEQTTGRDPAEDMPPTRTSLELATAVEFLLTISLRLGLITRAVYVIVFFVSLGFTVGVVFAAAHIMSFLYSNVVAAISVDDGSRESSTEPAAARFLGN